MAKSGEKHVRALLESHLISGRSIDILLRADFGLAERQRTILSAVEDLLIKERLDLPPGLRDIDVRIEALELKLRAAIVTAAKGDVSFVPTHLNPKVDDRIAKAKRKAPFLKDSDFASLTSLTASQRERYAYYGRAARTSLELSDKVHD